MLNKNLYTRSLIAILIICSVTAVPLYHNFTISQLFRGVFGNLSITSILLFWIWLLRRIFAPKVSNIINKNFTIVVLILATLLYVSAFGFIPSDIYGLGYFPNTYVLIGFFILEIYLWNKARLYAWLWLIAFIGFYFKVQDSTNLWDYLLDPLLFVFCIANLLRKKG